MKARELKAGDWFEYQGNRYICVDPSCTRSCSVVCWSPQATTSHVSQQSTVTPLPDCTGWDWEPEPEVRYRNEYLDYPSEWQRSKEKCDNWRTLGCIGYTIRRVWPGGRIEQEFVREDTQ